MYFYHVQVSWAQFTTGSWTSDFQFLSTPDNLWKYLPTCHITCLKILTIYLPKLSFNSKNKSAFLYIISSSVNALNKIVSQKHTGPILCVHSLCFEILWTNLINCMPIYIRQTSVILTFTFLLNINHASTK
jgi:hypothetical protein